MTPEEQLAARELLLSLALTLQGFNRPSRVTGKGDLTDKLQDIMAKVLELTCITTNTLNGELIIGDSDLQRYWNHQRRSILAWK